MPKCWNCGKEVPEGAVYCSNCGRPLAGSGLDSRTMSQMTSSSSYGPGSEEMMRRVRTTQTYSLVTLVLLALLWVFLLIP
jgi:predicted amidophosphoribosyltransferase